MAARAARRRCTNTSTNTLPQSRHFATRGWLPAVASHSGTAPEQAVGTIVRVGGGIDYQTHVCGTGGRHLRAAHAPGPAAGAVMVQQAVHQDVFAGPAPAAWTPRSPGPGCRGAGNDAPCRDHPCRPRAGHRRRAQRAGFERRRRLAVLASGWAQRPSASDR